MTSTPSQSITDLDTVFTPPTAEKWVEAALAGLPEGTTLETLQRQTLDGLAIKVLYEDSTAEAGPGTVDGALQGATQGATQGSTQGASQGATQGATQGTTQGTTMADPARRHDLHANRIGSWDNRLCLEDTHDVTAARQQLQAGLQGGNTSLELHVADAVDLDTMLQDVMLDVAAVNLRAGHAFERIGSRFAELVDRQDIDTDSLACSLNADPVGEWLRDGHSPEPIEEAICRVGSFSKNLRQRLPRAGTALVDTTIHHNAGASATQELQAAIATGALYLDSLLKSGMNLHDAAGAITFQMACDADALMGVVKLRSLDTLWQHLLTLFKEQSTAHGNEDLPSTRIVAETSRRYLSCLDPWNNHLRNIVACSAAAMGGASTIIVHPHDRIGKWQSADDPAIGTRMARNLPIILERECGLLHVNDPMAGSHAVESLTTALTALAWTALAESGDTNAWIQSIRSGRWQAAISATHQRRLELLAREEQVVVGVNRYVSGTQAGCAPTSDGAAVFTGHEQAQAGDRLDATGRDDAVTPLQPVRDAEPFEVATLTGDNA